MIPATPEQTALLQIISRLSNPSDGFNATFNSISTGSIFTISSAALTNMAIDFTSTPSKNFSIGSVDSSDFEETSPYRYPLLMVYTKSSVNKNRHKFQTFSGDVVVGIDVMLSWKHNNALKDFESYANCVSATVYTIMNRSRQESEQDQDWSPEVSYNGDIGLVKSGIKRAADNWYQKLQFTLVFEVNQ